MRSSCLRSFSGYLRVANILKIYIYKFAYCAYYLKDYANAENHFKGFVEVFPNSAKAEEMDYMRAYTFFKQSPQGRAGPDQYDQDHWFYAGLYQYASRITQNKRGVGHHRQMQGEIGIEGFREWRNYTSTWGILRRPALR